MKGKEMLVGQKSEQESAVCRAEVGIRWGKIKSVEEAQTWADDKTSRDWWANAYPHVVRIEVERLHGNVTTVAGIGRGEHTQGKGIVGIPGDGASVATMLHEMAHCVSSPDAGHGPEWARHFLTLTYNVLGSAYYMELYNAFSSNGVAF